MIWNYNSLRYRNKNMHLYECAPLRLSLMILPMSCPQTLKRTTRAKKSGLCKMQLRYHFLAARDGLGVSEPVSAISLDAA